jgi:hypothetical protein
MNRFASAASAAVLTVVCAPSALASACMDQPGIPAATRDAPAELLAPRAEAPRLDAMGADLSRPGHPHGSETPWLRRESRIRKGILDPQRIRGNEALKRGLAT